MARTMGKKREGGSSDNPNRVKKEGSGMRDKATIKRLLMYRSGKPTRDASGKVKSGGEFMSKEKSGGKDISGETGRVGRGESTEPPGPGLGRRGLVGRGRAGALRAQGEL